MSAWDLYPATYRSAEVQSILAAINAGECVSVIGLSGAGKSNLVGFLANRVAGGPRFTLVDCNALPGSDPASLFASVIQLLGGDPSAPPALSSLIDKIAQFPEAAPSGLCLLLDRFDLFNVQSSAAETLASNLRALRDRFKYNLTYVAATRKPLQPFSELAELFSANTLWLSSLSRQDAFWSIGQYASRKKLNWDPSILERIYDLSRGYPSMLRAVCEAYASGIPLDLQAMRSAPAVARRISEFWADSPIPDYINKSHLEDHPLLSPSAPVSINPALLTAAEQRLLVYFTAHSGEICTKDALIQAVWPDDRLINGLRDDSLAQLVHRLREKIDSLASGRIQTIPGRGYRYTG